jgi:hypothetical protein
LAETLRAMAVEVAMKIGEIPIDGFRGKKYLQWAIGLSLTINILMLALLFFV